MTETGIIIDDREDARLPIELRRFDVPIHSLRLDAGDACWTGFGPSGNILIGFEHKRLTDLIDCIKDRRFSGSQLIGMRRTYDRIELVIEGLWRPSASGVIECPNGGQTWHPLYFKSEAITYAQVDGYLQTLSECGDVRIWRTGSLIETAHVYISRYRWWQKPYGQHHAHDQIYSIDPAAQRQGRMIVHHGAPPPVVIHAAQIPGIDSKAWDVGEQFASVEEMASADVERWHCTTWTDSAGKTKRFGRGTAQKIVNYLRGVK